MPSPPCRVVLLLDLDCFYAQCERVRLGLDGDTTELALLQWNSALAVTYPARKHGIKRGDSWENVRNKSNGSCLAIHLPILKADCPVVSDVADVEEAYRQHYVLSKEQRQRIMDEEVGVKRFAHEGKACLERYRLASSRIFSVVLDTLNRNIGKHEFVLERASIDELFLDATDYCWGQVNQSSNETNERISLTVKETVIVGQQEGSSSLQVDDNVRLAMEMGCVVAKQVRDAVHEKLGFTLSAGISVNKMVAKLGASYGKPNGQAVIFPPAVPTVMNETKIRKVRNFGGKIGKKVQALLPTGEETMGSIARLLPLPRLCEELGVETGRMVFDASRGLDSEEVKETAGALVKSITAFKSFSRTQLMSEEIIKWISLLATDVISRVEQDCSRNERYPSSLSVQYTFSKDDRTNDRVSRSVRIQFPRFHEDKKKELLMEQVRAAVKAREGVVFLYRIGLCACDFEPRLRNGISSYFQKEGDMKGRNEQDVSSATATTTPQKPQHQKASPSQRPSEQVERKRQPATEDRIGSSNIVDEDMEYARKLQQSYDRENMVLSALERKSKSKNRSTTKGGSNKKKMKLDSFFRKV